MATGDGDDAPGDVARLCRKLTQNKDFGTPFRASFVLRPCAAVQNPKRLSDLLSRTGNKLSALKTRSIQRLEIVEQVRAALPARLAQAVASAGIDEGRLTIGVVGGVWASRLRYLTESVRKRVSAASGMPVVSVRVRVVPPGNQAG
jgi:hypothetical protein